MLGNCECYRLSVAPVSSQLRVSTAGEFYSYACCHCGAHSLWYSRIIRIMRDF